MESGIFDSWEEVKISTLIGVWKKLIITLTDEFEGFNTSRVKKKKTEDVVDISRELELEMTDLLQSYYKTLIDEELLLTDEQRKWFFEMESTLGEDAMKSF